MKPQYLSDPPLRPFTGAHPTPVHEYLSGASIHGSGADASPAWMSSLIDKWTPHLFMFWERGGSFTCLDALPDPLSLALLDRCTPVLLDLLPDDLYDGGRRLPRP